MNIILSAINTKHTHSALALACLKSYWETKHKDIVLTIKEFDLNILNETIINELILMRPDIIAFSTYIWSIERIITVCGALRAAFPNIITILGGPEVSYNSKEVMRKSNDIDFIINGEGELTFEELVFNLINKKSISSIKGITYRTQNTIIQNPIRPFIQDLDILPSPFTSGNYKGTASFTYYEASRGCPSKCAYCLSSIQGNVRNHSIERVKEDLDWFFKSDFDQIRFADRTFNYDSPRAREIITYIKKNNTKNKNFHFEIQADFLSDEIIELLSDAPRGMFHLEIGIQSTNPKALSAVHRTFDLLKMHEKVKKLREKTNCYLHLDVLGGLPYDSYSDFKKSLNDVASLYPEDIQISLVKVLHGTPYEHMALNGNFYFMKNPPYTILRTDWLAPDEAAMISQISKLYEGIGNSNRFNNSLRYISNSLFNDSYADLYENMVYFWRNNKLLFYNFSPENTVKHLKAFIRAITNDLSVIDTFDSKLEHELRLTLRSSNADTWKGPQLPEPLKKPIYKLFSTYKGYWYKTNPKVSDSEPLINNYPIIYSYELNDDNSITVKEIEKDLKESFVMILVQKKISPSDFTSIWHRLYPDLDLPDFDIILNKLIEEKSVLFTSHYNQ